MNDRSNVLDFRRRHADVWRVLSLLGLERGAQRQRGGALVVCPVHDESTPSCSVTLGPDGTIRFRCFGCDASGDVIGLFAAVHGFTLPRDLPRVLALDGGEVTPRRDAPSPIVPMPTLTADEFDRVAVAVLERCPLVGDVATYLDGRRVLDEAKRAGWGALPLDVAAQRRIAIDVCSSVGRDLWMACGLATDAGDGFAQAGNVVVIPYRAPGVAGIVTTLQRRRIDDAKPKYVFARSRSPSYPFGADCVEDVGNETAVVFAEGAIDALDLRRRAREGGLDRIVLGVPSASIWRAEWARFAAGRVAIVATDADEAGERVAQTMAADLYAAGATSVLRATPGDGAKDWNSQQVSA